jgi:phage terminase large subunit-like protein
MGIIGPTLGDAVRACYEGPSGIRAHDPRAVMVNRAGGTIVKWPNGSEAKIFGAHSMEDTDRLRAGGNNCFVWGDEIAAWRYLDDAYAQMRFGLRIGPRPRWIGSTTPRPRALIRKLQEGRVRNTVVTHATSHDNPHIIGEVLESLLETYDGTSLGAQEIFGRIVDQDENALFTREQIEAARINPDEVPDLRKITVGVDPSGGVGEQGIVVAGKALWTPPGAAEGAKALLHGFVLDDRTCHLKPEGWGKRAVRAAVDWAADDIVVEQNYGRDMAIATIRSAAELLGVNIPIKVTVATRGKKVRAEPVSALTAQGRWHHAGVFSDLEDQECTWHEDLDWSPDRLDAEVWTAWHLRLAHTGSAGSASMGTNAARRQIVPDRN